ADLSVTLANLYPEVPDLQISEVYDFAQQDPDAFLDDLVDRGRIGDSSYLLRMLGLGDEDISEVFPIITSEAEETRGILKQGGVPEDEIEKIVSMSAYGVEGLSARIVEEEERERETKAPQLYWDDVQGEWTRQPPLPGILGDISRTLRGAAEAPLFTVSGVPISASDIVAISLIGIWGAIATRQLYRRLIDIGKRTGSKLFEVALNTGLDKWIARQARISPESQNVLYRAILRDRKGIAERATRNWTRRLGERLSAKEAAQKATEDTIRELEVKLLPAARVPEVAKPPVVPPTAVTPTPKPPTPKPPTRVPAVAPKVPAVSEVAPTPVVEPVVTPEVPAEIAKIEATLPEGVRGLSPSELIETREEMGTLAGYTDDVSFRAFLGDKTKYWSEPTYKKAKAGQSFTVYRAVPNEITEIHSGAWVTQSR
ncbi:unnamed protein product, partial [marine sediment metagenome]